jgi:hypothetical protein
MTTPMAGASSRHAPPGRHPGRRHSQYHTDTSITRSPNASQNSRCSRICPHPPFAAIPGKRLGWGVAMTTPMAGASSTHAPPGRHPGRRHSRYRTDTSITRSPNAPQNSDYPPTCRYPPFAALPGKRLGWGVAMTTPMAGASSRHAPPGRHPGRRHSQYHTDTSITRSPNAPQNSRCSRIGPHPPFAALAGKRLGWGVAMTTPMAAASSRHAPPGQTLGRRSR